METARGFSQVNGFQNGVLSVVVVVVVVTVGVDGPKPVAEADVVWSRRIELVAASACCAPRSR